jgi:hypothetical protein
VIVDIYILFSHIAAWLLDGLYGHACSPEMRSEPVPGAVRAEMIFQGVGIRTARNTMQSRRSFAYSWLLKIDGGANFGEEN